MRIYKNKVKTNIALLILASVLLQTGIIYATPSKKTLEAARNVISNPTNTNIDSYTKAMLKEYKKLNKEGNFEEAADCLRAALYFLKQKPNSYDYQDAINKYNTLINKMEADTSEASRLELAKTLYLENKFFASAYEFSNLLGEGYEKDLCYEFLGDIAKKIEGEDTAFSFYKKAIEENPDNINAKYKYANLLLKKGEVAAALLYFEEVIENTNSNRVIEEIIENFSKRLEENPNDENNYGILGLAYQRQGKYDKTYQLLKKSLIINPKDVFLRYYLGNLLFSIKEYSFADEIYTEILEENPYESQIRISRAKSYIKMNDIEKAIKDYQIVLAMYPDSIQAQYGIYLLLKNELPLEKIINRFYPIEPDYKLDAEGYNNLGYFANKFGNSKDALVFFEKSLILNSKSEIPYIELYKTYQLLGMDAKAREILKKAYSLFPKSAEIISLYSSLNSDKVDEKNNVALSYLNEGDYKKAIAVYQQIEPKGADTYYAIANCYRQLGDFKNAILNYKKSLEINPNDSETYYALGVTYLEGNNQKKAKEAFTLSVQKNSKNIKSKKMLSYIEQKEIASNIDKAYAAYEKKDYKGALAILNSAVEIFPNDFKVFYYRGLTKEALGDYKGAISDFRETVKIDRNYAVAYFKLGENLEKINKKKEALYMYEKFLGAENIDENLARIAEQRITELGEKYY